MPQPDHDQSDDTFHGEAWTDEHGRAAILLPPSARGHRSGFLYELRALNSPTSPRVVEEARDGRFEIATGLPHVKVAWSVTPRTAEQQQGAADPQRAPTNPRPSRQAAHRP